MNVRKPLFYSGMIAGGCLAALLLNSVVPKGNNSTARKIVDAGVTTIRDAAQDIPQFGEITGHCPSNSTLCDLAAGLSKAR